MSHPKYEAAMSKKHVFILFGCLGAVVLIYAAFIFVMTKVPVPADIGAKGQFGDQFGALNTLFAGLGSAILLFTIIFQFSQLREQQKDLERQLTISEAQARALTAQIAHLERSASAQEYQARLILAQMKIHSIQGTIDIAKMRAAVYMPGSGQYNSQIENIELTIRRMAEVIDEVTQSPPTK
jgi:hypothetical protein